MKSIRAVRSRPVTVRVDLPAAMLGVTSCLVMMPSIRTEVDPLTVTAMITRVRGSKKPETNICWREEFFPSVNFN